MSRLKPFPGGATLEIDALIFGGGVAGLWLLTALRQQGYSALLVESSALGTGQTIWSQGIIHGGMKYALTGEMSKAARAIAAMPVVWRQCLSEADPIDLRRVTVLSQHQCLWTTGGATSRLGAFAASKVLRAAPQPVAEADRPQGLQGAPKNCKIYRLDEPVLEMRSLLRELAGLNAGYLLHAAAEQVGFDTAGPGSEPRLSLTLPNKAGGQLVIHPGAILLTAGAGNEALCESLGVATAPMQRRPLHQVLLKGELPPFFGHGIAGLSDKPQLTVTSAPADDGEIVWNVGGGLAESGTARTPEQQRQAARAVLTKALPWLELASVRISTSLVDRAEPLMPAGKRPDLPHVHREGAVFVCWPTKLAFAPRLSDDVVSALREADVRPSPESMPPLSDELTPPPVATPPWEEPDREWHSL